MIFNNLNFNNKYSKQQYFLKNSIKNVLFLLVIDSLSVLPFFK